ncbi:MAG: hypothetical protein LUG85_06680 [Clostridiales bacterium]|nr:hypothetical protein [Clostridiales bacterium]
MYIKKSISVLIIMCFCLFFAACQSDAALNDVESTDAETANSETSSQSEDSESVSSLLNEEDYTSEIVEPTYPIPMTLAECISYISYPDYDDSEKDDESEKYYSSGTLVMERTYTDNGNIDTETIYESDGSTISIQTYYEYDSELSYSVDYYENSSTVEKFKFTFADDETILYVYHMVYDTDSEDGSSEVEMYQYNSDGSIEMYIANDQISQLMSDLIMSALAQGLSQ